MPANEKPPWPGPLWAVQRDPSPRSSGLSRRDQRRMRLAMIFGRPLPPRLARTAVEYAPALRNQAWLGYLLVATGVLYAAGALVEIIKHASPWWEWAGHEVLGAVWLTVGVLWFRATRRAGRAAREGYWPERTGADE